MLSFSKSQEEIKQVETYWRYQNFNVISVKLTPVTRHSLTITVDRVSSLVQRAELQWYCSIAMSLKREHSESTMDNTEPPIFLAKKAKLQQETNSPDVMMDDTRAESPSTTHVQTDSTRLSSHVTPMYTSHFEEMNVSNPNDTLIKEAACGITEFVNPHLPGFKGFLKKRCQC